MKYVSLVAIILAIACLLGCTVKPDPVAQTPTEEEVITEAATDAIDAAPATQGDDQPASPPNIRAASEPLDMAQPLPLNSGAYVEYAGSDVSFSGVAAREKAEEQIAGALQVNISSGGMAIKDAKYMFYSNDEDNGSLYRTTAGGLSEFFGQDEPRFLHIYGGELFYSTYDGKIIKMDPKTGFGGEMFSSDRIDQLARINSNIIFSGFMGDQEGIFRLDTKVRQVYTMATATGRFLVDAINKQLIVSTESGIVAMDSTGNVVKTLYRAPVLNFSLVGDKLLIIDAERDVFAVTNGQKTAMNVGKALWVGAYNNNLFILDEYRRLKIADLNGKNARVLIEAPVYNPTFIGGDVWYTNYSGGGLTKYMRIK